MTIFLKPNTAKLVEGTPIKVFDPERKGWLPEAGAYVPSNPYWMRRLADGDVLTGDAVVEVEAAPKPTKARTENTLTAAELKAFLTAQGIEFPKNAKKDDLVALVEEITKQKEAEAAKAAEGADTQKGE
jgi:hypothetical protein